MNSTKLFTLALLLSSSVLHHTGHAMQKTLPQARHKTRCSLGRSLKCAFVAALSLISVTQAKPQTVEPKDVQVPSPDEISELYTILKNNNFTRYVQWQRSMIQANKWEILYGSKWKEFYMMRILYGLNEDHKKTDAKLSQFEDCYKKEALNFPTLGPDCQHSEVCHSYVTEVCRNTVGDNR